jgi:hypothetical protein
MATIFYCAVTYSFRRGADRGEVPLHDGRSAAYSRRGASDGRSKVTERLWLPSVRAFVGVLRSTPDRVRGVRRIGPNIVGPLLVLGTGPDYGS